MEFEAPHDRRSQTISLFVSAALAMLYILLMRFVNKTDGNEIKIVLLGLFILIVAMPYAMSVRRYILTKDGLVIKFLVHKKIIPVEKMVMITYPIDMDLHRFKRVFGSFGYFGYSGRYRNEKYGMVVSYTNKTSDLVLLDTEDEKYILSPYDSRKFLHMMKNFIRSKKLPTMNLDTSSS